MTTEDHTSSASDRPEGTDRSPGGRPLGFWLATVDRLIERELVAAFDDLDVSRRDWRLLNLIGREVRDERLAEKLAHRPGVVAPLVERGWVAGEAGEWHLTDDGRAALARLGERVGGIRSRIADAVPADDYATTIATLEAIARELGWSEAGARPDRPMRPGHRGHRRARGFRRPGTRFGRPSGFDDPGAREVHVHVHVHGTDEDRPEHGHAPDRHGDRHRGGHGPCRRDEH